MANVTRDMASGTDLLSIEKAGAVTSTQTSAALDITSYSGMIAINLDSAAGTGTSPTLDVKLQESATSGGTYTDVTDANGDVVQFTQVTGSASEQVIGLDADGSLGFIKAVQTVGGTSPSFSYSINASARKQVSD